MSVALGTLVLTGVGIKSDVAEPEDIAPSVLVTFWARTLPALKLKRPKSRCSIVCDALGGLQTRGGS